MFIAHLPLCNLHKVQTSLMRSLDFIKQYQQQKNIIKLVVDSPFFAIACLRAALMLVVALFTLHTSTRCNQLFLRIATRNYSSGFLNLIKQIAALSLVKVVMRAAKGVTFLTALSIFSNKSNTKTPKNHQKQGEILETRLAKCKQLLSAAMLVAGILLCGAANAAYVQTIIAQTAFVVPGAVTTLNSASAWTGSADDGFTPTAIALPFNFSFAGVNRTTVFIGTNGFLTFSAGSQAYTNSTLFSNTPGAATFIPADTILPFWDDLILLAAGGTITYGTTGTAPNRQFVVTWNAVRLFANQAGSQCNFQVVLGEDQTIRFRYGTSTNCTAASATTGIQESATTLNLRSFNTAITTQDVLYFPIPSLAVQKTITTICDPTNGTTNPKNIPGAIVRWTVTVTNNGPGSATLGTVGDVLSGNTTLDPRLITGAPGTGASCESVTGTTESAGTNGFRMSVGGSSTRTGFPKYTTATSGASFTSPNATINYATGLPAGTFGINTYTAGELKSGESVTVYFNVLVN